MKASILIIAMLTLLLVPAHAQIIQLPVDNVRDVERDHRTAFDSQALENSTDTLSEAEIDLPIFKAIGGLGLVLCLLVGGFFGLKKIAPQYFAKHASGKSLKVIETLSMGDRRSISLIRVGDSRFLIGNTPQRINFLATLTEPLPQDTEPATSAAAPLGRVPKKSKAAKSSFRNLFEVEKKRKPVMPLPNDVRTKMRQLREALEH